MSRTSMRVWGRADERELRRVLRGGGHRGGGTATAAASADNDPNVAERPSGATTRVLRVTSVSAGTLHRFAAAVTRRARATAATVRSGS